MNGYDKIINAKEDRKFMSMYYLNITSSKRFSQALKNGIKNNGKPRQQEFEDIIFSTWNQYLVDSGRALPSEKAISEKEGLKREVFAFLLENNHIEFRVNSQNESKGALKFNDVFYEVSITKHKKPVVDKVEVGTKLNPFIEELSEALMEKYSVIRAKNNAITIDADGEQTTINFTRKKVKLF